MEARKLWHAVVTEYEMDAPGLTLLKEACLALDRLRQAQEVLARDGIVIVDRWGQPRQHPATLVERDARNQVLKFIKELHLDIDVGASVGAPVARI